MADIPQVFSYNQVLGDMVNAVLSKIGGVSMQVGSPFLSVLEAAASSDFRASMQSIQALNSWDLDNASGLALLRIGKAEQVNKITLKPAVGTVTITDTSFIKISTTLYQGTANPIVGANTINVVDASSFPASGSVYIGRNTPDYEGPLAYTSKVNNGSFWTLNLGSALTKFHNNTENVILAQGSSRVIGTDSLVRTPLANITTSVNFRILYPATIPDGETLVDNVAVIAETSGTIGNIGAGAITEFVTPPFNGASVTNNKPFTNGTDEESDDSYKARIRDARASKAKGIALAITNSILGITAPDENKTISSSNLVKQGSNSTVYIDDGTGYEEVTNGVGIETLVASAVGGEQDFETDNRPIAKAFLLNINPSPYALQPEQKITVKVGGITSEHVFDPSDFIEISNALAQEVVSSINSDINILFQARTIGNGSNVILFAKAETNEDIEVISNNNDANAILGFSSGISFTTQLYKNDIRLNKDGKTAELFTNSFGLWNTMAGSQTLIIAIDNTPAATYTIVDQDFIDQATGFNSVGKNNINAWTKVLNAKIPGITADIDNGVLFIKSNLGPNNRSSLNITGGTLVTNRVFNLGSDNGFQSDYTVERNTGRISLTLPLQPGDKLSLGSVATRAFIQSGVVPTTTLANTVKAWLNVDGGAELISHGVTNASILSIAPLNIREWGLQLQLTANSSTFTNVQANDWVVLWDSAFDPSIKGAWRVEAASNTSVTLERRLALVARSGHRSVAMAPISTNISRVMTTGGAVRSLPNFVFGTQPLGVTAACEIYDPNTKTSLVAGNMTSPRAFHTCTALSTGKIYVTGGIDDAGNFLNTTEIYDPNTDTWTAKQTLANGLWNHRAIALADNKVLICGGYLSNGNSATDAYVYDPVGDTLTTLGVGHVLNTARADHALCLLPNGKVLVAGGRITGNTTTTSCELFDHTTNSFAATGALATARQGLDLGLIGAIPTSVLAIGNSAGAVHAACEQYEVYDIAGGTWVAQATLPSNTAFREVSVATTQAGKNYVFNGSFTNLGLEVNNSVEYDSGVLTGFSNALYATNEGAPKYNVQTVVLYKADHSYLNHIVVIGGYQVFKTGGSIDPTASIEAFDGNTGLFESADPSFNASFSLAQTGLTFIRTLGRLQELDIPSGTNYTASSISTLLNTILDGATSTIYHTNQLRINTNTRGLTGNIGLLAEDSGFDFLGFPAADNINNSTGHIGSVESSGSLIKQPSFQSLQVRGTFEPVATEAVEGVLVNDGTVDPSYALIGLKNWFSGKNTAVYNKYGTDAGYRSEILSSLTYPTVSQVELRKLAIEPKLPYDRVYLAAPFAITPNDSIVVKVDNDNAKEFNIKLARKLLTTSSTYSQTNAFKDGDSGNITLAKTFGLSYDFNDFAVYMKARTVLYSDVGTPNQRMLARYFRYGSEGNKARVRFSNPDAPNASVLVQTDVDTNPTTDIRIKLASGALRTPTLRGTSKIGKACTSITNGVGTLVYVLNLPISSINRLTGTTTAILTLPAGITNHGFAPGNVVWIQSTDVNFPTGPVTITAVTATDRFSYAEALPDHAGGAIGTASFDSQGQVTLNGSGATAGDFFRLNDPAGSSLFFNSTFFTTNITDGNAIMTSGEQTGYTTSATLAWSQVVSAASLQIFVNSSQTANQIISAVNALATVTNSTCPISLTVLGAGTGTVIKSTPEFIGDSSFWYLLSDGLNWVKKTIPAPNTSTDYQLTFKNAISGILSTNSDWANEIVYICPITLNNLIEWFNTPTVTGLWTVADIEASEDGTKVQISTKSPGSVNGIQVEGGLGNLATAAVVGSLRFPPGLSLNTIKRSDGDGLTGGQWCVINNIIPVTKAVFDSTEQLTSWTPDGLIVVNNPLYTVKESFTVGKMNFEKQGDYVAISDFGENNGFNFNTINPGDYIRIYTSATPTSFKQVSSPNVGIFRIIRIATSKDDSGGTVWIQNNSVIEETSECALQVIDGLSSVIPGDVLSINTPKWGVQNQGLWTIESVGTTTALSNDLYTVNTHMKVSTVTRTPQSIASVPAIGPDFAFLSIIEGTPNTFLMKINSIAPNQADGSYLDVIWDSSVFNSDISRNAQSIINVSNKLGFSSNFSSGADGYNYDVGLIGEANRVIYGDLNDPITYPGVIADGANINISGSLVKRLQVILSIRVRTPAIEKDVISRVKSAVASVINRTGVGQSVAISDIIKAASNVVGVTAVTFISPRYGVGNDLIPVNGNQKPFILNLDEDIQVLITGA